MVHVDTDNVCEECRTIWLGTTENRSAMRCHESCVIRSTIEIHQLNKLDSDHACAEDCSPDASEPGGVKIKASRTTSATLANKKRLELYSLKNSQKLGK